MLESPTPEEEPRPRSRKFALIAGIATLVLVGGSIQAVAIRAYNNSRNKVTATSKSVVTVAKKTTNAGGSSTTIKADVAGNSVVKAGGAGGTASTVAGGAGAAGGGEGGMAGGGADAGTGGGAGGAAGATTVAGAGTAKVGGGTGTAPDPNATTVAPVPSPTTIKKAAPAPTTATPTTVKATPTTSPVDPNASVQRAYATAQAYADALARRDAATVAKMNPTKSKDLSGYKNLLTSTVVPANIKLVSGSTYNARLGLIAQERTSTGDVTKLYCVVWTVNSIGTVSEKSGSLVRTVAGLSSPANFVGELGNDCA